MTPHYRLTEGELQYDCMYSWSKITIGGSRCDF